MRSTSPPLCRQWHRPGSVPAQFDGVRMFVSTVLLGLSSSITSKLSFPRPWARHIGHRHRLRVMNLSGLGVRLRRDWAITMSLRADWCCQAHRWLASNRCFFDWYYIFRWTPRAGLYTSIPTDRENQRLRRQPYRGPHQGARRSHNSTLDDPLFLFVMWVPWPAGLADARAEGSVLYWIPSHIEFIDMRMRPLPPHALIWLFFVVWVFEETIVDWIFF
jgi:hypothetical protein